MDACARMSDYRQRCLSKKGEECIVCGDTNEILVHHVDGNRTNNEIENLIPVCDRHHRDIHAGRPNVSEWVVRLGKHPVGGESISTEIKRETWKELNRQKEPGDSFDEVIQRLLHPEKEE